MQSYTTWNAITDMAIIYSIVVVISMLVAAVIRGIVIVLSRQAAHAEASAPPKPVAKPVAVGIPPEHIAAISAAVAMMMGAHRIVRIEMAQHGFGWTSEARATHHTSHLPRGPH